MEPDELQAMVQRILENISILPEAEQEAFAALVEELAEESPNAPLDKDAVWKRLNDLLLYFRAMRDAD